MGEICQLCCNELDETEKHFFPCDCEYQICLFCFHKLTIECSYQYATKCPNCRQPYQKLNPNACIYPSRTKQSQANIIPPPDATTTPNISRPQMNSTLPSSIHQLLPSSIGGVTTTTQHTNPNPTNTQHTSSYPTSRNSSTFSSPSSSNQTRYSSEFPRNFLSDINSPSINTYQSNTANTTHMPTTTNINSMQLNSPLLNSYQSITNINPNTLTSTPTNIQNHSSYYNTSQPHLSNPITTTSNTSTPIVFNNPPSSNTTTPHQTNSVNTTFNTAMIPIHNGIPNTTHNTIPNSYITQSKDLSLNNYLSMTNAVKPNPLVPTITPTTTHVNFPYYNTSQPHLSSNINPITTTSNASIPIVFNNSTSNTMTHANSPPPSFNTYLSNVNTNTFPTTTTTNHLNPSNIQTPTNINTNSQTNTLSVANNLNTIYITPNIHPITSNLNTTLMPTTNLNTSSITNQSNNNMRATHNTNPPQILNNNNNNKLNNSSLSNNSLILNELNTCNNTIFALENQIELLLKELLNDQYEFVKQFGSQEITNRHEDDNLCTICFENASNYKLSCGHNVFCMDCLANYIVEKGKLCVCPVCQKVIES